MLFCLIGLIAVLEVFATNRIKVFFKRTGRKGFNYHSVGPIIS